MNNMRLTHIIIFLFVCGALAGCTSLVLMKSEPPGATIATSDERALGTTPPPVAAYNTLQPHWLGDGVPIQGRIAARVQGCAEQTRALGEFNVPDEISVQLDCGVTSTIQTTPTLLAQQKDSSAARRLFMWEARAPRSTVYLYGTIHFCRPDCYPLPAAVTEALSRADSIAFELDFTDPSVAQAVLAQGSYPSDQSLAQDLPPLLMQRLAAYLTPRGIPLEHLQGMRPWMARMTLTQVVAAQHGLQVDRGIDMRLFKRARELGKPVLALETVEEQLTPMATASLPDQREWLADALALTEQGQGPVIFEEMLAAWRAGDAERLAGVARQGLGKSAGAQRIASGLIYGRNQHMAERISAWLDSGRNVFVAIGAMHLVGPGSIPELLAARGYATRQLAER